MQKGKSEKDTQSFLCDDPDNPHKDIWKAVKGRA